MSKKFFSLIHDKKVHLAPKTKVLSSEAFATVMDAQEILDAVKKDAEQYKIEVASECEKLKEQAQKEGFEVGYSEWIEKIAELETEIKKVRQDMEKMIVPLAIQAAKKIVGKAIEKESTIVDIVRNSLRAVVTHKKIAIYVNRKDLEILERNRDKIKEVFENLEVLSLRPQDDIATGGCIIETEGGIINAQLENQWMILENAFQKLLSSQQSEEKVQKEV